MSGISERQAKNVVQQLTELGLVPGANTSTDCLCLVNDPLEGDFDCWWVAWDEALSCWVAAHQHLAEDGSLIKQEAFRWSPPGPKFNPLFCAYHWEQGGVCGGTAGLHGSVIMYHEFTPPERGSWSEAPFQGW